MHIAAFRQLTSNKSGVANPSGSLSITATHPIDPNASLAWKTGMAVTRPIAEYRYDKYVRELSVRS